LPLRSISSLYSSTVLKEGVDDSEIQKLYSDYDKVFSANHSMTMGMEVEFYALDSEWQLIRRQDADLLLEGLPLNFTTDYYPYQIEIRTGAFDNPEGLFEDFIKLREMVLKKMRSLGMHSKWVSSYQDAQYCGTHFHIRYKGRNQNFWKKALCAYPFMISLTDRFKNWDSFRQSDSPHIGLPSFPLGRFSIDKSGRPMQDICVNRYKRTADGHRFKDVPTLEVRMFDTMRLLSDYEILIKYMFNIFSKINEHHFETMFHKNSAKSDYSELLRNSRRSLNHYIADCFSPTISKDNMNQILNLSNIEVLKRLSKKFGFKDEGLDSLKKQSWKRISQVLAHHEFRDFPTFCEFIRKEYRVLPDKAIQIGKIRHCSSRGLKLDVEYSEIPELERITHNVGTEFQTSSTGTV